MSDQPATPKLKPKPKRSRRLWALVLILAVGYVPIGIVLNNLFEANQKYAADLSAAKVDREQVFAAGKRAYDDGKRAAEDLKACKRRINPRDL